MDHVSAAASESNSYEPRASTKPTAGASPSHRYRWGAHWVALAAAAFTWPLLFVGGLVTTYKVGMAVPDWPTTFGINMFLYDFTNAAWGVFVEHGHRLYGSAVGLCSIALTAWFWIGRQRPSMRWLSLAALAAVIFQGVLGGIRVRWISTELALFHGCFGQLFFGLMTAIAVMTGRTWLETSPRSVPDPGRIRFWAIATVGVVYAQVIAGAWTRHYHKDLEIHAIGAFLVLAASHMLFWRVRRHRDAVPEMSAPSFALAGLLILQISLGIASWLLLRPFDGFPRAANTNLEALIATGHQANGALVLATTVVLALRACRRLTNESSVVSPINNSNAAPNEWEFAS